MRGLLAWMMDRRMATWQNDLVSRHIEEVKHIYGEMRGWRHDYHNHIQAMQAHLALGQTAELSNYLASLDQNLRSVDTILKTGNVMVDAILNSKLSLAASRGIAVNAKASVPGSLNMNEVDLCVLLGNLLDNTTEACLRVPDGRARFLRLYIDVFKEQLYISITNSTGGGVRKAGGVYRTTKDAPNHGLGLMRIDRIVHKYGGFVNRQHEEGVFATEVMLPL